MENNMVVLAVKGNVDLAIEAMEVLKENDKLMAEFETISLAPQQVKPAWLDHFVTRWCVIGIRKNKS